MWKVIKSKDDYSIALARIKELIEKDLIENTPEFDEYELLCLIIMDYESKNFKFDSPDPIDHIEFIMDQNDLSQKDMIPYFGSKSKVSEVLSRKRNLSLSMIKRLHKGLDIPLEILIQDIDKIDSEHEIVIESVYKAPSITKLQTFLEKVINKQLVVNNNQVSETEDNYKHKSIEYGGC